jgi:hypothetical protein
VCVIDGTSNVVVARVPVGREPNKLAWDATTGRTYVANYLGSSLSVIRDTASGVAESFKPQASSSKLEATVARGWFWLPRGSGIHAAIGRGLETSPTMGPVLLDVTGRAVMGLQAGPNDVRHLGPGVYFVRPEPGQPIRRVIVVR